jgi:hypothetical protein
MIALYYINDELLLARIRFAYTIFAFAFWEI